jgi:hypothetical protein
MKLKSALLTILFFTFGFLSCLFFVPQASAQTATPSPTPASSCATPSQVQGVRIDYPGCVGTQCNFTQATCSWTATAGATKYQLTVTEVESSTVTKNEQEDAAVTSVTFPVNQNKTYKCDVAAINACGTTGTAGTFSLFCKVDALINTPTPTTPPAPPPPKPTLPPTGIVSNTIMIGMTVLVMIAAGTFLMVL